MYQNLNINPEDPKPDETKYRFMIAALFCFIIWGVGGAIFIDSELGRIIGNYWHIVLLLFIIFLCAFISENSEPWYVDEEEYFDNE